MDVVATPVSILPQAPANAVAADVAGDAVAAALPTDGVFGALLAKQLGLGLPVLQLPDAVDVKPGVLSDTPTDKASLDAAELAAQLQMAMVAQPPANGSVLIQPPVIQSPIATPSAEIPADGAISAKIDQLGGQQRQVIAAIAPELATMPRTASAPEKAQVATEKAQVVPGKAQVATERTQAATPEFASMLRTASATERAQLASTPELDAARHAGAAAAKGQDLPSAAAADVQPAPTASAQALSSQQGFLTAQSGSALPSAAIQAPVASSAWSAGLGEKVVWMVGQQQQGVELHLNPPALGPLEVRVSMSEGQANLSFMTQHLPVRDAIEAATSRLREMLGESGISMGSVSVNVGTFAQQQPPAHSENGRPAATPWQADNDAVLFATPAVAVRSLHGNGMVDTFA